MRPIERIDNFLRLVNWDKLQKRWLLDYDTISDLLHQPNSLMMIGSYWKSNPDQRFGQMLVNLDLIPDTLLIWLDEESDILLDQGISPEDCLYWTSIYDKDNNLLDEPISKLLKELTTEHIVNIYIHVYTENKRTLSEIYHTAFNNILVKRKEYEALIVIQRILDTI